MSLKDKTTNMLTSLRVNVATPERIKGSQVIQVIIAGDQQ